MRWALETYPVQGLMAMRKSPQSPFPPVSVSSIPPPPQLASPRLATATATRPTNRLRPRVLSPPAMPCSLLLLRGWSVETSVVGLPAGPCGRVARDAVEHHAQSGDGDAGCQPLAEQLVLGEAGDDDVAEASAADHAADDHHGE